MGAIRDAGIKHFGVRVHGAGDYPEKLRIADNPVELVYFQGLWDLVHTRCVAIVGTREPSPDGRSRAAELARLLAKDGYTVVSGLARGIDTAAHTAAMDAGGFTIAVLGTPITECYPPENRSLQQRISDKHLVISQVPARRRTTRRLIAYPMMISSLSPGSIIPLERPCVPSSSSLMTFSTVGSTSKSRSH